MINEQRLFCTVKSVGLVVMAFSFWFFSQALATDASFFYSVFDEEGDESVRAITIQFDSDSDHYAYRSESRKLPGVLLKNLSSGGALLAHENEDGFVVHFVALRNGELIVNPIFGILADSPQVIDIREGDAGTFHIGWMSPNGEAIQYAHVDPSSDKCCLSVAGYRFQGEIKRPPPFYLTPHVLVGRGFVANLQNSRRLGNPVTMMYLYVVSGKSGAIKKEVRNQNVRSSREEEEGVTPNISGTWGGGLTQLPIEVEVGTPLQPEGRHAWYGGSYLSLSHHLNVVGDDVDLENPTILTLVTMSAPSIRDTGSDIHYKKRMPKDVSILSNLAVPINSYRDGMGRGGLAWLEAHPGHKVLVKIYRDGSFDEPVSLTPEIAGAVSVRQLSGESLYWLDQGEYSLPVIFIMTGENLLYQIDLEDPEGFTVLPGSVLPERVLIWPPIESGNNKSVAIVAALNDNDQLISIHHVYRRWRGANLEYLWEKMEQY